MNATVFTRKQETRLGDTITTVRTYERDSNDATGVHSKCVSEAITIEGPAEITVQELPRKVARAYY